MRPSASPDRDTAVLRSVDKMNTMSFHIFPFDTVTSTNDVAMSDTARYGHGSIVTARQQTAGRGQRGNRWVTASGENLLFSLVLEPTHIRVEEQFLISEMAALAASDAIRAVSGGSVPCRIKWPNDLYVGDRKIGGILIEHALHSEFLSRSVLGIGINVAQREFDPALPNPTSLAREMTTDKVPLPAPEQVLEAFCTAFPFRYGQPAGELHADFMARLWRGDGEPHRYRDAASGEVFEALIADVEPLTGEMTLRLPNGTERRYWFKEVEALF